MGYNDATKVFQSERASRSMLSQVFWGFQVADLENVGISLVFIVFSEKLIFMFFSVFQFLSHVPSGKHILGS